MITTLKYDVVALDEENGVLTVGFADDPADTREYLLFQNWVDAEAAGEDGEIYVERNGPAQGTHGGVERFLLFRDHARVLLDERLDRRLKPLSGLPHLSLPVWRVAVTMKPWLRTHSPTS